MSDPSQPDQGDPRAALKQEILLRKLKKSSVARAAVDVIYQDVAIELADRQQPLPLSWAQQRLWFIEQMGALGSAYHIPVALRLSGALNLAALQAALDGIVQRHEILRTRIATVAGVGQQIIADAATARFSLQISDLSTDPAPSSAAQLQQLLTQEAQTPFDLVLGPLIRGRLLRLAADEHVLCVVMHHLVADGWSLAVLTREWGALYTAACQHPQETLAHVLPPLPVQYADYALWQRNELRAAVLQKQLEYWCQRLNHAPARLELPTDHPRPAVQSHAGARVHFSLPPALSIALRALTRHAAVDVTLFMLLQAAWALVLARLSGQDDVVIGVPLANRSHMQLEPLIGFFVNTLALRVQIAPGQSVVELLQTIKAHTLAAYAHQDVPFEQVVEALRPARSLSHSPIFQVMLALQQGAAAEMTLPGLTLASQEIAHTTAQFDLALVLHEKVGAGGTLQGELIYATALFEGHTVARWLAYFTQVLAAMVDDPWQAVEGLSLWDAPARSQYLHEARLRQRRFPAAEEQTLVAAFEAQVAQRAAATALTWEGLSLSYAELNARANRLARYLQTRGLGAEGSADEPRVALCLARGVEMIVGLLAILKAGGAYVPIDPSYPAERIAFLLHDSQAALILTQSDFLALLGSAPQPIIALDREQAAVDRQAAANLEYECALSGQRLAYVIYTSGSTGQPKGVMVEHRQVMRLFAATRAGFQFSADDVWTLFHSYAFDFSVWEIWGALLHGGRLVIVPHLTTRSPDDFYALLCHEQVSVLNQTPMAFRQLMAAQAVAQEDSAFPRHHLRVVIFGGEALDYASLQGWVARNGLDQPQLVNMYGITETTVHVTWHRVNENDLVGGQGCCIGEAIPDLQVYLLDACAQPVPVGVVGEIYVGGAGLARGYWARPELTRERFIRNPLTGDTDARLYRSGDLARWRADGTLDYLGRSDQQVKIRGFRIELGEIEACLRQHPAVHDALVLAYEVQPGDGDGDRRLVAYLVSATAELESVKRHLQARLPEYMQPAAWVQLAALPLTAHGKLDRAALPAPTGYGVQAEHIAYAPPQSELEIRLANIWQKTLGLGTGEAQRRIGRHDDFFELGGHSLLIMRLLENLRQQGIQAQVRQIFSHPTPAALAAALSKTASVFTDSPATPTIPANLIPIEGSAHITPAMLPLLNLTQAQIDQIVARTAGGAANIQDIYPLAPLQEGLLFHHLLDPGHDAYLLPVWMKISATENLDRFVAALQRVIQQHDILRTAIHWEGLPQPVQVVLRQVELPHVWLCSAEHMDAPRLLSVIALQDAPLLRLQSVCDAQTGSCSVLLQFHHIISDHVALEQILDEIRCLLAGMGDALPPPIPYRNHVAQGLAHKLRYAAEVWFRSRLGDLTEPTAPWGLLDVQGDGRAIEEARQSLSAEFSQRLRQLARQQHVSCAALFHVAWALVLARTSGRDDVVFGTVFSGRLQDDPESSRALGLFINTLPLRLQLQGQRIDALVQHVHHELLELLSHEQTPLSLAQACSGLPPPTPLFTALLNYRHGQSRAEPGNQHDFGIQVLALEERTNYPLTLNVDDRGDGFVLEAQVDRRVAATRVLAYMHTALAALLDAVSGMPQKPALTLDVLPTEERHTLLETPNATATAYDLTQPLTFPLNRQAQLTPDAIAVEWGEQTLSYRQLHTRANQLAHHLIQQGIGIDFSPDQVVALYFERSVDMLIAILATLKAGAAYLPLDPHHPRERTQHILNEAQARIILTQHKHAHQLPSTAIPSLSLDAPETHQYLASLSSDPPTTHPQPHHLAYIIYTSGSTGQPKGAMNEHRAVVNRLLWMQDRYRLTPDDRILQKTPYSFDVSVWELLWPLISGARLILAQPNGHQDPAYLQRTIDEAQITTVHFVPSMLQAYLDHLDSHAQEPLRHPQLKRIIVSGEELSVSLHDRCLKTLPHVELHNLYGPTEAAIDVTYHPCQLTDTSHPRTRIPIGKPIANTRIYILDPHGQPVPIGVTGELHIGGTAVGRGYVNRPELTAERFLPDPYSTEPHARMYKSGDLARWNADGEIEYLGRNDQQIKLRGLRIELGEIEAQLRQHTQIKEACVIAQDGKQLIAYYVPNVPNVPTEPPLSPPVGEGRGEGGQSAEENEASQKSNQSQITELTDTLKTYLQTRLPEYMIPAIYVPLAAMPLSANGKLDRKALPLPQAAHSQRSYEPPQGEIETRLAEIWQEILQVERVGRQDDFFALGGHSLTAIRLMGRLNSAAWLPYAQSIPLRLIFEAPTLAQFAQALSAQSCVPEHGTARHEDAVLATILPLAAADFHPLSYAQRRLWWLSQIGGAASAYHIAGALRLQGVLDKARLQAVLQGLLARHDALSSTYIPVHGEPMQWPARAPLAEVDLQLVDWTTNPVPLDKALTEFALEPIHLETGPLLRARLFRLGAEEHILAVVVHHIAADGWSIDLALREVALDYAGQLEEGEGRSAINSAAYAHWQRQQIETGALDAQRRYWLQRLAGELPLLQLPSDRPRPLVPSFHGGQYHQPIPAALAQRVVTACAQYQVTPFMLFLAIYQILLARLSGQSDLLIGVPFAGRQHPQTAQLVGLLVNTLVLRADLAADPEFAAHLRQVKADVLEAQSHQDYPFDLLVEQLNARRDLTRQALFDTTFTVETRDRRAEAHRVAGRGDLAELTMPPVALSLPRAKFDLSATVVIVSVPTATPEMTLSLEYSSDLFDASTIARYARYYLNLLEDALTHPERALSTLRLLSSDERHALLVRGTAARVHPVTSSLPAQIERMAQRAPQAIALRHEGQSLSYGELEARAQCLAHYLIDATPFAVQPGDAVALCMERGFELVISMLAVLKTGACYVPIEPHLPVKRLRYLIRDSGARCLLSDGANSKRLGTLLQGDEGDSLPILCLQQAAAAIAQRGRHGGSDVLSRVIDPDSRAYIIYTSGSTGQPKGCALTHANVLRLFAACAAHFDFSPEAASPSSQPVWSFFHSCAFDFSVWEIFGALLHGGRVVIVPADTARSPADFAELMAREGVTYLSQTPSSFLRLLDGLERAPWAQALRYVVLGGEALEYASLRPWYRHALNPATRLINMYGITETTVHVTWREVTQADVDVGTMHGASARCNVGRPLDDLSVYILDAHGEPQPEGVAGELYVGGAGLARGYLNRPQLTAERFVERVLEAGQAPQRLYRSGDLARWVNTGAGEIDYLGRLDQQVKVHGYRIEPGEIEVQLMRHPAITACVVMALREPRTEQERLVAWYCVHANELLTVTQLRGFLSAVLPDYMMPHDFVALAAMPLTVNGKIDRARLRTQVPWATNRHAQPRPLLAGEYVPPSTPAQIRLAQIWSAVLGVERIGLEDNFFDLGGDSFSAYRLMARLSDELERDLPLEAIFRSQTIAAMCAELERTPVARVEPGSGVVSPLPSQAEPCLVMIQKGAAGVLPFFCAHPAGGDVLSFQALARALGQERPFYGIQSAGRLLGEARAPTLEAMCAAYWAEIRAVQTQGPYFLGGHSMGGKVAYELARQIEAAGERVGMLAIFDADIVNKNTSMIEAMMLLSETFRLQIPRTALEGLSAQQMVDYVLSAGKQRFARVLEIAYDLDLLPRGFRTRDAEMFLQRIASNIALSDAYVAPPIQTPVTLFLATDHTENSYLIDVEAWRKVALGGLRVHEVPGNHLTLVQQPFVETLAKWIRKALEE